MVARRETAAAACLSALAERLPGRVRADEYNRMLYATDASIYRVMPHGVVIPRHRDDVQAVMECAAEHGVAVLPRTAGSSLAGQAVNEAIVVDFTRHLDAILDVDEERREVTVEPGVVLDGLNRYLRPHGLMFGPDPASSNRAAMGGIVANNSTGSHSIAYGMTADHVRRIRAVLSDGQRAAFGQLSAAELEQKKSLDGLEGRIYRGLAGIVEGHADIVRRATPRHWRRCGGYNLDRLLAVGGPALGGADAAAPSISFHGAPPTGLGTAPGGGFNVAQLLCGSEGTLGIFEDITLGLVDIPKVTGLGIVHFDNLEVGLAAVEAILETAPSAVELLDDLGMSMCRRQPMWRKKLESFTEGRPNCILITEYTGETEAEVEAKINALRTHVAARGVGATHVVPVTTRGGQQDVWGVRKMGLGFLMSVRGDHKPIPFIEDAAVPVAHLSEYVAGIDRFCKGLGFNIAYYAHASAGCVHIRPMVNTKSAEELAKMPEIMHFAVEQLRGFGGSLSSEHGDGRARSPFNRAFFGAELYGLYEEVKRTFDPRGLLNPGMITGAAPMTENLRYGAAYTTRHIKTHLDWSQDEGLDQAIEMCNGAGVCRKTDTGTMCPSFMATREEEHSTRGRANALRAVLSGALPAGRMTHDRLYETMDLCLQCKACAAECPSSVDMATLKVEFLAQHYERHGVPLRARLFAGAARQARLLSGPLSGIVNRANRVPLLRVLMEHVLGIHRDRDLPPFARRPFGPQDLPSTRDRSASHDLSGSQGQNRGDATHSGRPRVVLFNDTFNTYHYPDVARAAARVLDAAGFEVVLPGHGCCGRPALSKGLVEDARRMASETLDRLAPLAREGLTIVGLEPSCVLTFGEEYRQLLPGDPRVPLVAEHTMLFDDFVADLMKKGAFPPAVPAASTAPAAARGAAPTSPARILLHGHCHQKASVGTAGTVSALRGIPGCDVSEVDAGCCGMAGSFGFEKEHYDLSMQIGRQRLFPAVEAALGETWVVAPGVSCRQQIAAGTGKRALHTAEVLAAVLGLLDAP